MQELLASLFGGGFGLLLGLLLGGQRVAERIATVRRLVEAAVKDPAAADWNQVAAEVKGLETDARLLFDWLRRAFRR